MFTASFPTMLRDTFHPFLTPTKSGLVVYSLLSSESDIVDHVLVVIYLFSIQCLKQNTTTGPSNRYKGSPNSQIIYLYMLSISLDLAGTVRHPFLQKYNGLSKAKTPKCSLWSIFLQQHYFLFIFNVLSFHLTLF